MAQVTIQNFDTDSSNILGVLDVDGLTPAGNPSLTASAISLAFTDGRAVALSGAFGPVVTALSSGDETALIAGAAQIRVDSITVTISGTPWINIAQLDLTGTEILNYINSSGATDESDINDALVDGAVALVFEGNDTIVSGIGDDNLRGYAGNDIVLGGDGDDTVFGDAGDDDVNGNLGVDYVTGGQGADFVRGGQGSDEVFGDEGDDWHVNGNIGDDDVWGGLGNDTMFGGQGNDFMIGDIFEYGVGGNDVLNGDLGDDTLVGDPGNDTMTGGDGVDAFLIYTGDGDDVITDFVAASERIEFETNINQTGVDTFAEVQARMSASNGGTLIDLGEGNTLFIQGVAPGQLTAANFDFF